MIKHRPRPPITPAERAYRLRVRKNKERIKRAAKVAREREFREAQRKSNLGSHGYHGDPLKFHRDYFPNSPQLAARQAQIRAERAEWAAVEAAERRQRARKRERTSARARYRRQLAQAQATPAWANPRAILLLHAHARLERYMTGIEHDVDHIVPIISDLVCGLHCEQNMRVIPERDNAMKSNRFWPNMPD